MIVAVTPFACKDGSSSAHLVIHTLIAESKPRTKKNVIHMNLDSAICCILDARKMTRTWINISELIKQDELFAI